MLGGTGTLLNGRWYPAFRDIIDGLCEIRAKVESVVGGTREDQDSDSRWLHKAPILDPIILQEPRMEEQRLVSDVLVAVAWSFCHSITV